MYDKYIAFSIDSRSVFDIYKFKTWSHLWINWRSIPRDYFPCLT